MLTPSVNLVQSSFPDAQQGEISGLSRSVSNLGSSLGTAIAGTILVAGITVTPGRSYALGHCSTGRRRGGRVHHGADVAPQQQSVGSGLAQARRAIRSATEKLIKIGRRDRIW